jgi:hypothetical protein
MSGKCPSCGEASHIVVDSSRARDEVSKRTVPVLQFLCGHCRTILSVTLDPEWQAQIVASQLRMVGQSTTSDKGP